MRGADTSNVFRVRLLGGAWVLWSLFQLGVVATGWRRLVDVLASISPAECIPLRPGGMLANHGGVILGAVLLAFAFLRAGAPVRRMFPLRDASLLERRALSLLLGFAALGTLLFGLALAGLFYPAAILGAAACGLACPGERVRAVARRGGRAAPRLAIPRWVWPALAPPAVTLLVALVPSTQVDVYIYHLFLPSLFLKLHRFCPDANVARICFPLLAELVYTYGVLAGRDALPHFLQLTLYGAAVALLAGWVQRVGGDRAGWLAATGLLSLGLFEEHAWLAKNTLASAAFPVAGAVCLLRGLGARGGAGWVGLGALCFGCGVAVKLNGAPLAALGFAAVVLARRGRAPAVPIRWLALAAVPMAPWLAKSWLLSGDPVWPVLAPWLRGALWDPESTAAAAAACGVRAMPATLRNVVADFAAFWRTGHPLVGLSLPFVLLAGRRLPMRARWAGAAACAGWAAMRWLVPAEAIRFALPVWMIWIGVTAVAVGGALPRRPRRATGYALAAAGIAMWLPLGAPLAEQLAYRPVAGYLAGRLSHPAYLARATSTYADAGAALAALPGVRGVLVLGDERCYRLPGRVYSARFLGRNWGWEQARECGTVERMVVRARQANLTHVLYNFTWDLYVLPWLAPFRWDARMVRVWRSFVETRLDVQVPVSHADHLNGGLCIYRIRPTGGKAAPGWLPYCPGLGSLYWEATSAMARGDVRGSLAAALRLNALVPRVDFITDMVATGYRAAWQWDRSWLYFQEGLRHGTVGDGNTFKAGIVGVMAGHPDEGFALLRRSAEIFPDLRGPAAETELRLRAQLRPTGSR